MILPHVLEFPNGIEAFDVHRRKMPLSTWRLRSPAKVKRAQGPRLTVGDPPC